MAFSAIPIYWDCNGVLGYSDLLGLGVLGYSDLLGLGIDEWKSRCNGLGIDDWASMSGKSVQCAARRRLIAPPYFSDGLGIDDWTQRIFGVLFVLGFSPWWYRASF